MKKTITVIAVLFAFLLNATAQDLTQRQVPAIIVNKFKQDYPKAKDVKWELKGINYEVEFEIGYFNNDYEILYSPAAEILKYEQELSKSELPKHIISKINNLYPNYRIKDIKLIKEKNKIYYKFEANKNKIEIKVLMDHKGNISA